MNAKLVDKFEELGQNRKHGIQERQARVTLGASVMRVFAGGTDDKVRPVLGKIRLDGLPKMRGQQQYRRWFEKQLERVAKAIYSLNRTRSAVNPGYKWGHAAKILNLFMDGIVRQSRYFTDKEAKRIEPWLYVPLDSRVMGALNACDVDTPTRIRKIASSKTFYRIQDEMGEAAACAGVSRILFDDVWASGDDGKES